VFQTALAGGVSNISFSSLSADLGRTMYRYSFRIPPYYTLLVRSLSVLEGIALASDPNYKVGLPGDCCALSACKAKFALSALLWSARIMCWRLLVCDRGVWRFLCAQATQGSRP
jgi:hypothetical protein